MTNLFFQELERRLDGMPSSATERALRRMLTPEVTRPTRRVPSSRSEKERPAVAGRVDRSVRPRVAVARKQCQRG